MKSAFSFLVTLLVSPLSLVTAAQAACEDALVMSTYKASSTSRIDWRSASLVDQSSYEKIKQDAGVSATIYGVPIGANYSDFQQRVSTFLSSKNESLSTSQIRNVLLTALDPNAPGAYRACLDSQVFSQDGLRAASVSATESDITIVVKWFEPGNATAATVTWDPPVIGGKTLPTSLPQGLTAIRLPRPNAQIALSGSYSGRTTGAIVLDPLPAKLQPELLAMKILGGYRFTISFGQTLPGGHIGTLYPNRSWNGTYNRARDAWRLWGPNSEDGHFVDSEYCPSGCQGKLDGAFSPAKGQLVMWGGAYTFNEAGDVFLGGVRVGTVVVSE